MTKKTKNQNGVSIRNRRLVYAFLAIIVVSIPAIYYFYSAASTKPESPRAAIVDQLSSSKLGTAIRNQNATFIEAAEHVLQLRFSAIDYYSDNATVDHYTRLASLGYKLIVWRGHSALDLNSGYVALSSTDKYGLKDYDGYLENDELALCNITGDDSLYFGITPKFIEQVMGGKFTDTVIFLMSCNGLNTKYLKTAEAFQNKGAKVIMSWDNWVSSIDNDGAADILLRYLINENDTISEAVGKLPLYSPDYGWAQLKYYPEKPEVSNYRIPDYRQPETAETTATAISAISWKVKEQRLRTRSVWSLD